MRFVPGPGSLCFSAGPVLNKALEIELGWGDNLGLDLGVTFKSRGDHAGFRWWVDLFKFYVGFKVYDTRHWCWEKDRWYEPGEEPVFEGYPHE